MNKDCGIYYIYNTLSNKGYIGSSSRLERRFIEHRCGLRRGKHNNKHLLFAYNKYGEDSFIFKILCYCPREYQYKLEQWFLDKCSLNHDYNICKEVILPPKVNFTDEQKKRISEQCKERALNPEVRERLSRNINKLWKDPSHISFMKEINKGENHPQCKITENLARSIKIDMKNGKTIADTARKYNVNRGICKSIKYNKSWKFLIV